MTKALAILNSMRELELKNRLSTSGTDAAIAELKAKDEEIKNLNCRAYHAEGYINDLHNHPKDKKFYDAKARSIVAMLFWEWRKAIRIADENGASPEFSDSDYWYLKAKEEAFRQAYTKY